jgi:hypothetical protein
MFGQVPKSVGDVMARLWVPLDVDFQDDDRLIDVTAGAELLYVRSLALAKRLGTDGRIRRSHLRRLSDKLDDLGCGFEDELIDAGLWRWEGSQDPAVGHYQIASWDRWNDPVKAEKRARAGKSRGGKLGNHRRHGHPGPLDDCPTCYPPSSDTDSDTDRSSDSHTDRSGSVEVEVEVDKNNPPIAPPATLALAIPDPPPKKRRKGKRPLPDNWAPTDKHRALGLERGIDVDSEAQRFRDYCAAHAKTYADHDAAFRNWLTSDLQQQRTSPSRNGGGREFLTATEQRSQRNAQNRRETIAELTARGVLPQHGH